MKKTSYVKTGLIVAVVVVLAVLGFYVIPSMIGGSSEDPVPVDSLDIGDTTKISDEDSVNKSDLNFGDLSLGDIFKSFPDEYCDKVVKENVLIYDEENFYIKAGDDLTKGDSRPSYDYCEFAVFKDTKGGDDIYAISKTTETSMMVFGGLEFLKKEGDEFVKVTDEIMALVDFDKLKANGAASIAAERPDLATEGLEENYYIELPRYGTTLKFKQYNTGDTIYELKWNGSKFTATPSGYDNEKDDEVSFKIDPVLVKDGFAKYCSDNLKICFSITSNLNVFEYENSAFLIITDVKNDRDLEYGDAGMTSATIGLNFLYGNIEDLRNDTRSGYLFEYDILEKGRDVTIGGREFYKVVARGFGDSGYSYYFIENEGKVYDFQAGFNGEQAMVDLIETLEFVD